MSVAIFYRYCTVVYCGPEGNSRIIQPLVKYRLPKRIKVGSYCYISGISKRL